MSKKGRHTSAIQNELLLASLTKFFSKQTNLKVMLNVVNGTSNISLRLIDWFVTNYCKKYNISIVKTKLEHINVYIHYRSQLRAFSKHLFDPFRRQDKISFYYEKQNYIQTTIGQLNFFRWAIENDIIAYIESNYATIVQDMNTTQKEHKVEAADPPPRKTSAATPSRKNSVEELVASRKPRQELSKSHMNNMSLAKGTRMKSFD